MSHVRSHVRARPPSARIQVVAHALQYLGAAATQHADRTCDPRSPARTRSPVYQNTAGEAPVHTRNTGMASAGVPLRGLKRDQGVEPKMRPAVNGLGLFSVVVFRRDQNIERVRRLSRERERLNLRRWWLQEGRGSVGSATRVHAESAHCGRAGWPADRARSSDRLAVPPAVREVARARRVGQELEPRLRLVSREAGEAVDSITCDSG